MLLRVLDEPWAFPPNYAIAPQPLAALDLRDHADESIRRVGREVLDSLADPRSLPLVRRSARARALVGPVRQRLLK